MRKNYRLVFLCLVLAVAYSYPASAVEDANTHQHGPAPTAKALRKQVAQLGWLLEEGDGGFSSDLVRIHFTCGSDKAPDCRALVLFAISPILGNASTQYLAIFDPVDGAQVVSEMPKLTRSVYYHAWQLRSFLPIRDGAYSFDGVKYSKGKVTLSGVTWGSNDAHCCPSEKIAVTFRIKDGVLIPVNSHFLNEGF